MVQQFMWPSLHSVWARYEKRHWKRILKPSWLFANLHIYEDWTIERQHMMRCKLLLAASPLPTKIMHSDSECLILCRFDVVIEKMMGCPNRGWNSCAAQHKPLMSSKVGRNLAIAWTPWLQMLPATQGQALEQTLACPGGRHPSLPTSCSQTARNGPEAQWSGQPGSFQITDHLFQIMYTGGGMCILSPNKPNIPERKITL